MTFCTETDLAIHRHRVPDLERIRILPRYLGAHALAFENSVFDSLGTLAEAYRGGFWEFYELSNGGFYMAPEQERNLRIVVPGNGYEGELSPDAAGIVACLFAFNAMAWRFREDRHVNLYHWLRDYALDHDESGEILRAID